MVFAIDAFFGKKVAAQLQWVAHHAVHARRSHLALHHLRRFFAGHVEACASEGVQVLECGFCCFQSRKSPAETPLRKVLNLRPHHDELIGIGIGHGSEQGRVDHGIDGRGGADAESQGKDYRRREAEALAQHAQTEAEILKYVLHWASHSVNDALLRAQSLHGFNDSGTAGGHGRCNSNHKRDDDRGTRKRAWIENGNAIELAAEEAGQGHDRRQCNSGCDGRDHGHFAHNKNDDPGARRA